MSPLRTKSISLLVTDTASVSSIKVNNGTDPAAVTSASPSTTTMTLTTSTGSSAQPVAVILSSTYAPGSSSAIDSSIPLPSMVTLVSRSKHNSKEPAIIGGSLAGAFVLTIIVLVIVVLRLRRKTVTGPEHKEKKVDLDALAYLPYDPAQAPRDTVKIPGVYHSVEEPSSSKLNSASVEGEPERPPSALTRSPSITPSLASSLPVPEFTLADARMTTNASPQTSSMPRSSTMPLYTVTTRKLPIRSQTGMETNVTGISHIPPALRPSTPRSQSGFAPCTPCASPLHSTQFGDTCVSPLHRIASGDFSHGAARRPEYGTAEPEAFQQPRVFRKYADGNNEGSGEVDEGRWLAKGAPIPSRTV